jgi:hypothetical protein
LTHAELVTKTNAICNRVDARFNYYSQLKPSSSEYLLTAKGLAKAAPKLASTEQTALVELRRLTPPTELASDWKKILAGAQTLATGTTRLGEYAKANNLEGASSLLKSIANAEQQAFTAAKRDGFVECTHHL